MKFGRRRRILPFFLKCSQIVEHHHRVNFRDCNTVVHDIGRSFVLVQCPSINSRALEVNKAKLTILWASSIARLRNWNLREKGVSNTIMRVTKSLTFFEKSLSPFPYYSLSFSFFKLIFSFEEEREIIIFRNIYVYFFVENGVNVLVVELNWKIACRSCTIKVSSKAVWFPVIEKRLTRENWRWS